VALLQPSQRLLASASALASAPPTASPVTPPPSPIASLSAQELFADDVLDANSGWQQLSVKQAYFAFTTHGLASVYDKKGDWAYAVHELERPQADVMVTGDFRSSGLGYFGWLCGDSTSGRYYGAVPETDGSLVFIDGGRDGVNPLERYEDLSAPIADDELTTLSLECVTDGATVWLAAYIDGALVGLHDEDVTDVHRFDVVGAYGESLEAGFAMSVERAAAFGSGGLTGAIPFTAAKLLHELPDAYLADCDVPPQTSGVHDMTVRCYLQDEGAGAEMADFAQLDESALADAFTTLMAAGTGLASCSVRPSPSTWSTVAAHGRVGCTRLAAGIELVWTNEIDGTLGVVHDLEGDYAATATQWQTALGLTPGQ
jgi:hypothetical protein